MSDDDYLWDKSGDAPDDVKRLEALLSPLAHDPKKSPLDELRMQRARPRSRKAVWIAAASLVVVAAAIVIVLLRPRADAACGGGTGMAFEGGEVSCGGARIAKGVLPVGGTLDTGKSTTKLAIAKIGTAELGADTRVRLDRTSATGHNLHLERGSLHAKVNAPPRLFAITTPSTAVTDLGCEYFIAVDAGGRGSIRVTSGKVELQANAAGTIVVAPAGTTTKVFPGNRPGIPLVSSASPEFVAAIGHYEEGAAGALDEVLAAATPTDAISLVNIAVLEPGNLTVLQRMGALAPSGTWSVDVAVKDRAALEKWRDEVVSAQIVFDALLDR